MTDLNRRSVLALGLGAVLPWTAHSQSFPSRPLKIVVPNAAGGAADLTARTVAQKMAASLGQGVVIENKPSAGGVVAGELVARAEPDGYTMLLVSSGTAVSAALFKSLPFDTLKDFAPVSMLATFDLAIVVKEGGRFRTLAELLTGGPGPSRQAESRNAPGRHHAEPGGGVVQGERGHRRAGGAFQWHAAGDHGAARRGHRCGSRHRRAA